MSPNTPRLTCDERMIAVDCERVVIADPDHSGDAFPPIPVFALLKDQHATWALIADGRYIRIDPANPLIRRAR